MGKMYLILVALAIFSGTSYAKEGSEEMTTSINVNGGFPHLSPDGARVEKTILRLRAKTYTKYFNNQFMPVDSSNYSFSNGRGGYTALENPNNDENVYFDKSVTYIYDRSLNAYTNRLMRMQQYDENNKVTLLSYTAWKELAGIWRDSARYLYQYKGGKLTESSFEIWYGSMWSLHASSTLEYNSNNLAALNSTTYNATFDYDANNNVVAIEDQQWSQSAGWQKNEKKLYTYTDIKVQTYTLQKWSVQGNRWENTESYEYAYNGGSKPSEIVYKIWDGSNWVKTKRSLYVYDAKDNKLKERKQVWNTSTFAFEDSELEEWAYNDYNLPVTITSSRWNATTGSWYHANEDYQIRFYYEVYFPTQVNSLAKTESSIQCYPIPAKDNINIDINLSTPSACSIMMMDMQGHIVKQWEESTTKQITKTLNVGDINAGNYFVKVMGANEALTKQITIIH